MPYLTLGKPRVVGLLLFAAAIAYIVAEGGTVMPSRLALLMAAGGFSAMGASMMNHYLERDVDALMARTRERPLASGRIASPRRVMWLGFGLAASGTALGFVMSMLVGLMIGAGAIVYVLLYTLLLKRRTHWSVVIGGASGSCAVLAGWFAGASPSAAAFLLAGLLFTWQSAHFWPLALAR
ncbi:MAG: UbiA family prenyltransferase, partial [Dehalococcoidia bacterium]